MSTRAATRRQELEEQLAKLISMMGQQQERQEQQQERQEAKLIGMMEQQLARATGAARECMSSGSGKGSWPISRSSSWSSW